MINSKLNTIQEIISNISELKSVAILRKEGNLIEAKLLINKITYEIFEHYREVLAAEEANTLTETCLRLGYMLNGEDYNVFKQKCISGEYKNRVQVIDGRKFDVKFFRLSPDVFLDWLQEYIFQRGEAFVNSNVALHKSIQHVSGTIAPEVVEVINKVAEKASKMQLEPEKPTESKYQLKIKELQKWIEAEFESKKYIHGFNPHTDAEIIFANIKNRPYSKAEYVKLRYEEIFAKLQQTWNKIDHQELRSSGHFLVWEDFICEQIDKLITK